MTTTAAATEPFTARAFLFGREEGSPPDALLGPLQGTGAAGVVLAGTTRPLTAAAQRAVEGEMASVVDSFLSLDLFDVAAGGWRKHVALRDAARRTRATPGSEEVVALATHEITSRHRPYVDVLVDGVNLGTLDVGLDLTFRITGLVAVVRDAQLVALRSGECKLTGYLTIQQILLAKRQAQVDLPGIWRLHRPLALLRNEAPSPPPTPPPPPLPPPQDTYWRGPRGR
ncbi:MULTISPECIES: hypothetical protein [unclassified Streptomyces]|uniref:hypothetical protein n=1 Tax=unclassified Streptomyces TaxID=2593676 RepID=UPI003410E094